MILKIRTLFIALIAASAINATAQGPLACNPTADPGEVCQGSSCNLYANASGGTGTYTFQWTSTPPGFVTDLPNPVVSPSVSTTYHLWVTDGNNSVEGSVDVTVYPLPSADAGTDASIPYGTTITLYGSASGGSGDYAYHWTPEDFLVNPYIQNPVTHNLFQSTLFHLEVADLQTGCVSAQDDVLVLVTGGPLSVTALADPELILAGDSSQLQALASGGTENYVYAWTSDPAGFSSSIPDPVVSPIVTTTYYVTVNDGYNTTTDDVTVFVYASPYSVSGGGRICAGSIGPEIFLDGSEDGVVYKLYRDNEYTGNSITGDGQALNFGPQNLAGEYTVRAVVPEAGGEVLMPGTALISYIHWDFSDEICMITTDSLSGKNVVLWEKNPDPEIASYNIYRESSTVGYFDLIGNVSHDSTGLFTDNSSNPLQRSYSYALRMIDICDHETFISPVHSTMHLSINTGIDSYNLIWTPYSGFSYQTYFIYRRQSPEGFQVIDSVPASILSWSDLDPPEGTLDYLIGIKKEGGCDVQKEGSSYSTVFSNIISTNVGIIEPIILDDYLAVMPNPSHGKIILQIKKDVESLEIYDARGAKVMDLKSKSVPAGNYPFDLGNRGTGIYLIRLNITSSMAISKKILVY